jgi:hypothetical protein
MSEHDIDLDRPVTWMREPPGTEEVRQKRQRQNGADESAQDSDFSPEPWVWCDPTTIPPRPWLLGTTLMCGYSTVLGSMGGIGKTAYAIACALAVITGRHDILGQHVFKTGNAWLTTLEDDRLELERRVAAAMIAHRIDRKQVEGRLFINDTRRRPLLLAKANEHGAFEICADAKRIAEGIRRNNILFTTIDPLVKSHRAIENSNEHMDGLIALGNDIASDTRSSILVACHFRKGGGEDGARDAIRGGGALIDGARLSRTLVRMSGDEAKAFNISPDEAFRYVRINDPKQNMAPPQKAEWIELASVPLGNTAVDPAYPSGDNVQAAKPWKLPSPFAELDLSTLHGIFARLRSAPEPGWFYSLDPRARFKATNVLVELAGKSKEQAKIILKAWETSKVVSEAPYTTPSNNTAKRIVLDDALIEQMLAPLRGLGVDR